jgi:hypothetical protein
MRALHKIKRGTGFRHGNEALSSGNLHLKQAVAWLVFYDDLRPLAFAGAKLNSLFWAYLRAGIAPAMSLMQDRFLAAPFAQNE